MSGKGRSYAQIKFTIWNDDDFRDLPPAAQHLYFVLLTDPGLTYAGTGDWHLGKIAARAAGWTAEQVKDAAALLIHRLYILVDEDTEEFLIRSFIRNDDLLKQPNLSVSMANARGAVASRGIRGVVVHELKRLHEERPELVAFKQDAVRDAMNNPALDPASYPCGDPYSDPGIDPPVDPWIKGEPNPGIDPSIDPSAKGQAGGQPEPQARPQAYTSTCTSTFSPAPSPEGGKVVGNGTDARETASPPTQKIVIPDDWLDNPEWARCHKHANEDFPPPCGGCADARKAAERASRTRAAERQQAIDARRQTITACSLCDDTGQIVGDNGAPLAPSLACTHDEEANAEIILDARQRAEAEAAAEAERRERAAKAAAQARELRARLAEQRTSA